MEIWGRCEDCARWFYLGRPDKILTTPNCPVCGSEPVNLANLPAGDDREATPGR